MLTHPQSIMLDRFCKCGPYKQYEIGGAERRVLQRLIDKGMITPINPQDPHAEVSATQLGQKTNAQLRRWDDPDEAPEWTAETFARAKAGSPSQTKSPT